MTKQQVGLEAELDAAAVAMGEGCLAPVTQTRLWPELT